MIPSDLYYRAILRIPAVLRAPGNLGVEVPTPDTDGELPDGLADRVSQVLGLISWGGTAAGVVGILITGAVMAISHKRGESSEHMSRLGMVLGGCILVAMAGPIVTWIFPSEEGGSD
ncbi:hypothetical protein SAMN05443287_103628 [Micromonospora phaseoli]|uniref:TrbC/VIRB2 family protein n=1 Tax=Micromonospora phaseoli TaxID=1144548 RepID=A0A1H6XNC1_9ACTN|nr:hypothetical protein [Micromonospora phaseoli]PZW02252.1 hypothetical protein CLV64_102626 [Micromonospora phaseoli]GIJ75745.1 hypothetical protein Xph01_01770 [Micromonospora phaseoli]SEJ28267.1 hypothetical protein SAMN05443287_103628 [Micromonospora phaseoli]